MHYMVAINFMLSMYNYRFVSSLTLYSTFTSPCAVDSLNPGNRHSQHPPCTPIPHHFSQLLQARPRSRHYLLHPPFLGHPLLLLRSPHANITSFSRPYALVTYPKNNIFCLVALCNNDEASSHFPYLLQYRLICSPYTNYFKSARTLCLLSLCWQREI